MPIQTTFSSEGATAMSPIDVVLPSSNTGTNEVPLLSVFQTPPGPAPT